MKTKTLIPYLFASLFLLSNCKTDELLKITKLETGNITEITYNSAKAGAEFIDISGNVSSYGHCWGFNSNPTTAGNKNTVNGIAQKGLYISDLTGLNGGTKYYVRAYAQDGSQVVYGNEVEFTTSDNPYITITSPASTDHWVAGETNSITWNDNIDENVNILLYKNSNVHSVIVNNTPSSGQYNWVLPDNLVYDTDYKIRLISAINSNIYGESQAFKISEISGTEGTVIDNSAITYNTIKIGKQWWMAENLKNTLFPNFADIPFINSDAAWGALTITDKAYCWYNDQVANKDIYGGLYTWAAAMNGAVSSNTNPSGVRGICPVGWHLPSDAEWEELVTYLGGDQIAGGKLKETATNHWQDPNEGANNSSGFTGLPGGLRNADGPSLGYITYGYWWSATEYNAPTVWYYALSYLYSKTLRFNGNKESGLSIRCLKD